MAHMPESVQEFKNLDVIAVAGASDKSGKPGTAIYKKVIQHHRQVFPVNPRLAELEGATCYSSLTELPTSPKGVIIVTRPEVADLLAREAVECRLSHVWFHRSIGTGSVSDQAVELCRRQGIRTIVGGCPMMYYEPIDFPHRCMRFVLNWTRALPE